MVGATMSGHKNGVVAAAIGAAKDHQEVQRTNATAKAIMLHNALPRRSRKYRRKPIWTQLFWISGHEKYIFV